ncbi:MAG: hypothetical protein JF599_11520 [Verrucomicrobia bacterium]|nr:hypothetical protein [Verrucomicrobiota bacterium]
MKFCLFIHCLLWGGLAVTLSAEGVKFTAVSLGASLPDVEYKNGAKPEKLTIPAFSRSEVKNYSGMGPIDFYTTVEKEGKKEKVNIAEVTFPEKTSRVLLVFSPQADGTAKVQALDDTPETMPRGSTRLYNATAMAVAIRCNEDTSVLPPNQQKIMPLAPPQVVVQMAYQKQGQWVRGGGNVFATDSNIRQTIFVVTSDSEVFKVQTPAGRVALSPLQSFTLPELVETETPQNSK